MSYNDTKSHLERTNMPTEEEIKAAQRQALLRKVLIFGGVALGAITAGVIVAKILPKPVDPAAITAADPLQAIDPSL